MIKIKQRGKQEVSAYSLVQLTIGLILLITVILKQRRLMLMDHDITNTKASRGPDHYADDPPISTLHHQPRQPLWSRGMHLDRRNRTKKKRKTEESDDNTNSTLAKSVTESYTLRDFIVTLNQDTKTVSIAHRSNPDRAIWKTVQGQDFLSAAKGVADIGESRGMVSVSDKVRAVTNKLTIEDSNVTRNKGTSSLTITGNLYRTRSRKKKHGSFRSAKTALKLRYEFKLETVPESPSHLQFSVALFNPKDQSPNTSYNRIFLNYHTTADEKFFGFGEQFSHLNMKGYAPTIVTSENGLGRHNNKVLHSWDILFNVVTRVFGVSGKFDSSYGPVPHYITNQGHSVFLENYEISVFDLKTDPNLVTIKLFGPNLKGRILHGDSPLDLITSYTEYAGRMAALPDWLNSGAVVGMQGGTKRVRTMMHKLQALGTPIAAFWLQDWVGKRKSLFGSQLWWNWVLNKVQYPQWSNLVKDLESKGTRVMTYINPFLVNINKDPNYEGENLYETAKQAGYLVRNQQGKPYLIPNTDFSAGLLDLTNPEARDWIKGIIKKNVIGAGASGWMADFGEALPFDAVLASGESPETYHNKYPEEWAKINKEAIEEANRTGDIVFFSRSAFSKSPGITPLFWQGDQMTLWDQNDGLKSAVTGLLSGGVSGFSLNHNDIGGYTSCDKLRIIRIRRSRELLMRWMEMNAFTAVFRTHEGIQPEKNAQFYTDDETLGQFSRFAKVYAALSFYRKALMQEAAEFGHPLVRHPFLHYPKDPVASDLKYQWMLGSEILVAPVTKPGEVQVNVYIPGGSWIHVWTEKEYRGGEWHLVDAPIGSPAVFYRKGSAVGETFRTNLQSMDVTTHVSSSEPKVASQLRAAIEASVQYLF